MNKLEIIDRELTRVRETIDVIASEEVKQLIDELELLLYQRLQEEEIEYGCK